jgi:tripartite-type tricarboxylate transporter receptor subunit TctC
MAATKNNAHPREKTSVNILRSLSSLASAALALGSLSSLCSVSEVAAQAFPSNFIRIVVPTAPSTPPDIISRVIANELQNANGWRVIVENKPGAVQTLAGADVVKQPPDGYSIFAMSVPVAAAPSFVPNMPFSIEKDLIPVAKISTSYNVLVVHPGVAAKNVAELVTLLKSNPDKFNFSSGGFGTPAHLIGEMFKLETGAKATHVPYQQFPQAIGDLLNGTNQYMFITTLPVVELIAAGKLRALAVTGPKRLESMKDVPTIVEQGFPNLVVEDWVGFAVKSGTPKEVVDTLNKAINAALEKPEVRAALAKVGADPAGGSPEAYGALLKAQVAHWAKVVKDSGMKLPQ